ncbi:2-dehydropantoate 2-reductase [Sphingosinicella humi]|uniref:2-dehydropantoate 2-reductase n=1 Tax=Allosphingosinicella humi TaxID=2068657 RepID=A0A2U2IYZ0_9SPHN|nr:2-dehydropantoate 2-reductase [Sphingosinicella humi]PWG01277.1 2-dehydropantoate 2-reductase [Sphingosinicella humi]
MRIAVVGVGAIGGWVATRLAEAGHDVAVLARGATLEAIRANGLVLRREGDERSALLEASDDAASLGRRELVVFAVKAPALASAAVAARPLIDGGTSIVPMLNGVPWWFLADQGRDLDSVDPDGVIAGALPLAQVIGCVVHASCSTDAPGVIRHIAGNGLIFGEPAGGDSLRLTDLTQLFAEAGFAATASPRIQKDIWYKLWGNMTMNPISALTAATCDRILDDELVEGLVLSIMAEAQEIGARIGCPIEESGRDRIAVTRRLGAFKTSMLQDVEGGRPIELDALLGAPREIGRRVGVETPNMDALFGLVRLFARERGLY